MAKLNEIKLFVYEHKKKIILVSCLLLLFMISTTIFLTKNKEEDRLVYDDLINETEEIKKEEVKETSVEEKVYYFVDVKGYVNNPGVYSLLKGKRVVDAINQAGGLKKEANTSLLNLSMELHDGMVIVVYSNSEVNNYQKVKEEEQKKEEICNVEIKNEACICNDNTESSSKEPVKEPVKETEDKEETSSKDTSSEKININTANLEQLMTLSKIGKSKALAIIEYRTKIGLFKTIEEIKNVSGIGDVLFESLKAYITV